MERLILTRKVNDEIIIGCRDIVIRVLRITDKRVYLAFTAPLEIGICREEVYEEYRQALEPGRLIVVKNEFKPDVHFINGIRIDHR